MNGLLKYGIYIWIAIGCLGYLNVSIAEEKTAADKEYDLVYKIKSGQKRKCTYELSVSGEVKVVTFGRHPLMKFSSKVTRTINDQIQEVKQESDGSITSIKLKREYSSSVVTALEPVNPDAAMDPGPEKTEEKTKSDVLDKKTFEISYSPDGTVISQVDKGESKDGSDKKTEVNDATKAIIILHDGDFGLLAPNKKVKAGDEWDVKSDVLAQVLLLKDGRPIRYVHQSPEVGMRFDLQDSSTLKCTFIEVVKTDGVDCAKIKLDGQMVARMDDILNTEIAINGFVWLALNDGAVRKVELDGDMKMDGEYPSKPTDKGMVLRCRVQGRGKMTLKLQSN
jgi:hypothetical protein